MNSNWAGFHIMSELQMNLLTLSESSLGSFHSNLGWICDSIHPKRGLETLDRDTFRRLNERFGSNPKLFT